MKPRASAATLFVILLFVAALFFAALLLSSGWLRIRNGARVGVDQGQAFVQAQQPTPLHSTQLQPYPTGPSVTGTPPPPPALEAVDNRIPFTITVVDVVPFATLPPATPLPPPPPTWTPLPTISSDNASPFASQNLRLQSDESLRSLTGLPIEGWDAVWSPTGDMLLYSLDMSPGSDREYHVGNRPLILADLTMGTMEEVAKGHLPVWSPSGRYALFQYWDVATGEQGLELLNISDYKTARIYHFTDGDVIPRPEWISDTEVVFNRGKSEDVEPVVLNVTTGAVAPLIAGTLKESMSKVDLQFVPTRIGVSPGKGLLAIGSVEALFVAARVQGSPLDFQVVRVLPGLDTGVPVFSPAGDALAYLDWQAGLRIVSLTDMAKDDVVVAVDRNSSPVVWSTDGASILFTNLSGVHIVNRDGSGLRTLPEAPQGAYRVQSSGARLSFASADNGFYTFVVTSD